MDIRLLSLCLCTLLQNLHCIAMETVESEWTTVEKNKPHKKKQQNFESKKTANAYSRDNAAPAARLPETANINEKDKNDAWINQKGYKGRTPLMAALLNGIEH